MPSPTRLFNRGFVALMFTQFFGAMNDNVLKQVLFLAVAEGGVWAGALGEGGQGYVSLFLTVPFILLSGLAGQLADRTSKQKIAVLLKVLEVVIALIALAGFLTGHLPMVLTAFLLLAIHSAFFGPAKYGMIPELVRDRDLSQANGSINMTTNIAVIAGTVVAGPVYSLIHPESDNQGQTLLAFRSFFRLPADPASLSPMWLAPGLAMLVIAAVGLAAALFLPKLTVMDAGLKIDWNPIRPYWRAIKDMSRTSLLLVAIAWAYFYLIGWLSMMVLSDYRQLLNVTPTMASGLVGILAIAIGIGSIAAGFISGKRIEPRLIPWGAAGMTIFFVLLGLCPLHYGTVLALLLGSGIFAGLYIVPLQALLQHLSPSGERGRFLGTANALSFIAMTAGSLIFRVARKGLEIPANRVFLICAVLAFAGTGILIWRMRKLIADPSLRRREPNPI